MAVFGYIELHSNIRIIWIAYLLIAVGLVALFEFAWWSHWFAEKSFINSSVPFTHAKLREEVIKNKKSYMSFENKVVDIGSWAMHHPGGRFSIEYNFGKDIGRYLFGVYALNRNYRAYKHS